MTEPELQGEGVDAEPPPVAALARRLHQNPLGGMLLQADRHGLRRSEFWDGESPGEEIEGEGSRWIDVAARQLDEYFARRRTAFELPLLPEGSSFQRRVWAALQRIPYADTCSYGDIAAELGDAGAARAVGGANNKNPLPIFIPCHRVIGGSGRLVGFGGGLDRKHWLLDHEQQLRTPSLFPLQDLRRS